jgi:hypothetical protein
VCGIDQEMSFPAVACPPHVSMSLPRSSCAPESSGVKFTRSRHLSTTTSMNLRSFLEIPFHRISGEY